MDDERTRLDTLSKVQEELDNVIQGEVWAKKDAMGQPIHDEDSSQDELTGKGSYTKTYFLKSNNTYSIRQRS